MSVDTSYEPFSREPEYIEGNRQFVSELPFQAGHRVLDLACGTGAISETILEFNPNLSIIGIDISRESLDLGRTDFIANGMVEDGFTLKRGESSQVIQVEGSADQIPTASGWADAVFMGHSIHMLPDPDKLLKEIFRVMKPGAFFAFNSSFYAGSQAPGTDAFYRKWWQFSLEFIQKRDAELRADGKPGITRKRGTMTRAEPWTSEAEWIERLTKHGFTISKTFERSIEMTCSSVQTIGAYSGLARLMLSGYPVELASEALIDSVAPAMESENLQTVPRLWLEITAQKPTA